MKKKNIELLLELKEKNSLRDIFPKDDYGHISLKIIGRLDEDDIRFLNGKSSDSFLDEDTGEVIYQLEEVLWETISLDLSDIKNFVGLSEIVGIKGLINIIFPAGCETIGGTCFEQNSDVQFITISNGTTEIKSDAFSDWKKLQKIVFPETLKKISPESFIGCNMLQYFDLSVNSKHFCVCNEVLFSADKSILIAFPPGLNIERYEVPIGTTLIAECAFKQNPYIKEIIIPHTVVRILDYAFENCVNLETIIVDQKNPVYFSSKGGILLERTVFEEPYEDALFYKHKKKIICVPAATARTELKINGIILAPRCFSGCKNIKRLDIGSTYCLDAVFKNCWEVEEIDLSYIEALPRLSYCENLRVLNIKGNFIGNLDYSICRNMALEELNITENSSYYSIDGVVFSFSEGHKLVYYPPGKKDEVYKVPSE